MTKSGNSLAVNMLWNSIGSLVYLGCTWLTTVLVVILSDSYGDSGTLAIAMATGNVFSTIALFRVRTVQVADINNNYSTGDYIGTRFFTLGAAFLVTVIYALFTVSTSQLLPACLYMIYKAIESFVDVYQGVDQSHDRFDIIGLSQLMRGIVLLTGFVLGMTVLHSIDASIVLMSLSTLAVVVFYDRRQTGQFTPLAPTFNLKKMTNLLLSCLPGFVAMFFVTLVISYSRQQFGLIYGSEALGVYAAIAAPTVIVQALASYVYAPLVLPVATAWNDGDVRKVRIILLKFIAALVLIILICLAVFYMIGEPVMTLIYGSDIADSLYLMYPLLICTGITALVYFLQDILIVLKQKGILVIASLLAFGGILMTMNPLFDFFYMNGITVAIIFAYMLDILLSVIAIVQATAKKG